MQAFRVAFWLLILPLISPCPNCSKDQLHSVRAPMSNKSIFSHVGGINLTGRYYSVHTPTHGVCGSLCDLHLSKCVAYGYTVATQMCSLSSTYIQTGDDLQFNPLMKDTEALFVKVSGLRENDIEADKKGCVSKREYDEFVEDNIKLRLKPDNTREDTDDMMETSKAEGLGVTIIEANEGIGQSEVGGGEKKPSVTAPAGRETVEDDEKGMKSGRDSSLGSSTSTASTKVPLPATLHMTVATTATSTGRSTKGRDSYGGDNHIQKGTSNSYPSLSSHPVTDPTRGGTTVSHLPSSPSSLPLSTSSLDTGSSQLTTTTVSHDKGGDLGEVTQSIVDSKTDTSRSDVTSGVTTPERLEDVTTPRNEVEETTTINMLTSSEDPSSTLNQVTTTSTNTLAQYITTENDNACKGILRTIKSTIFNSYLRSEKNSLITLETDSKEHEKWCFTDEGEKVLIGTSSSPPLFLHINYDGSLGLGEKESAEHWKKFDINGGTTSFRSEKGGWITANSDGSVVVMNKKTTMYMFALQ